MKKLTLVLMCLVASFLWAPWLAAQEGISVSPRQLNIAVKQGQTETRVILIRAAEPITDLLSSLWILPAPMGMLSFRQKPSRLPCQPQTLRRTKC